MVNNCLRSELSQKVENKKNILKITTSPYRQLVERYLIQYDHTDRHQGHAQLSISLPAAGRLNILPYPRVPNQGLYSMDIFEPWRYLPAPIPRYSLVRKKSLKIELANYVHYVTDIIGMVTTGTISHCLLCFDMYFHLS